MRIVRFLFLYYLVSGLSFEKADKLCNFASSPQLGDNKNKMS